MAEAAQVLGTTVAAVKLRAHRAYEALRAALGDVIGGIEPGSARPDDTTPVPPADPARARPRRRPRGARRRATRASAATARADRRLGAPVVGLLHSSGGARARTAGRRPTRLSRASWLAGGRRGGVGRHLARALDARAARGRFRVARRWLTPVAPLPTALLAGALLAGTSLTRRPTGQAPRVRRVHDPDAPSGRCSRSPSFRGAEQSVAPRLTGAAIGTASGAMGRARHRAALRHASPTTSWSGTSARWCCSRSSGRRGWAPRSWRRAARGRARVKSALTPSGVATWSSWAAGPRDSTTALALRQARPSWPVAWWCSRRPAIPREKPCAGRSGARGDALLRALGVEVDVPSAAVDGISFRGADGERPGVARAHRARRAAPRVRHALARTQRAPGHRDPRRRARRAVRDEGERAPCVDDVRRPCARASSWAATAWAASYARRSGWARPPARAGGRGRHGARAGRPRSSCSHFDASDLSLRGTPGTSPPWSMAVRSSAAASTASRWTVTEATTASDVAAQARRSAARAGDRSVAMQEQALRRARLRATSLRRARRASCSSGRLRASIRSPARGSPRPSSTACWRALSRAPPHERRGLAVVAGWRTATGRSRLARDLRIRTRFVHLFYGPERARGGAGPDRVARRPSRRAASTSPTSRTTGSRSPRWSLAAPRGSRRRDRRRARRVSPMAWTVRSSYGARRLSMRGNGMVSRTWGSPQIQATVRSMPRPKPACGNVP